MNFERLDVWKRSAALSVAVFKHFKSSHGRGLKDQITRSSLSISSNIAEGYERMCSEDCVRFLYYAKGSCGELRSQLYISMEIGEIDSNTAFQWINETTELSKMLGGLIKVISKS